MSFGSNEEMTCLVGGEPGASVGPGQAAAARAKPAKKTVRYTEEMQTVPEGRNNSHISSISRRDSDVVDDSNVLSHFHEDAIIQAKVGYFQLFTAFYMGLCIAAETVELFGIPYILPSAEVELCIKDNEKGWLGYITLIGLSFGGFFWGSLGDRLGRKKALLSAMAVHALFSGVATFMPTYGTFMTLRFFSAVGAGGALPIAYTYLAECCPSLFRGGGIGLLVSIGALGGMYVALLAWLIIPTTGEMVILETKEHFNAWHRFLIFCSLPIYCAIAGIISSPESPRYLVETGSDVEAMMVYQKIFKQNNKRKISTGTQYQLSEIEVPNKRSIGITPAAPKGHTSMFSNVLYSIKTFWHLHIQLFMDQYLTSTVFLLIIWTAVGFSLYGFLAWCPEYLKFLKSKDFADHKKTILNKHFTMNISDPWENLVIKNSAFDHMKFSNMVFSHIDFVNCTFDSVEFISVKSSRSHFIRSNLTNVNFTDTDLFGHVFVNCTLKNITEFGVRGQCPTLDLDYNIYVEESLRGHLISQLALIPAAILTGLVLTIVERPKILGASLFVSSVISLCLVGIGSSSVLVLTVEGGLITVLTVAWTTLILSTIECFPTHLRCTGFGLMAGAVKLAGLFGTLAYQSLVEAPIVAPALLTSTTLIIACLATYKLPTTRTVFL